MTPEGFDSNALLASVVTVDPSALIRLSLPELPEVPVTYWLVSGFLASPAGLAPPLGIPPPPTNSVALPSGVIWKLSQLILVQEHVVAVLVERHSVHALRRSRTKR